MRTEQSGKIRINLYVDSDLYLKAIELLPKGTLPYCIDQFLRAIVECRVVTITENELNRELEKAQWKVNKLKRILEVQK